MEDKRLPKCLMFGELVGGRGLCGGLGKQVDRVFLGRPQSFRHQRRPVEGSSPGREVWRRTAEQGVEHFMAKWNVAAKASVCTKRDGKDQREDRPKQADSCWFTRRC